MFRSAKASFAFAIPKARWAWVLTSVACNCWSCAFVSWSIFILLDNWAFALPFAAVYSSCCFVNLLSLCPKLLCAVVSSFDVAVPCFIFPTNLSNAGNPSLLTFICSLNAWFCPTPAWILSSIATLAASAEFFADCAISPKAGIILFIIPPENIATAPKNNWGTFIKNPIKGSNAPFKNDKVLCDKSANAADSWSYTLGSISSAMAPNLSSPSEMIAFINACCLSNLVKEPAVFPKVAA